VEGAETAGVPYGIGVDGAAATGIIGTDVATDFDTGMGAATGVGGPAKSIGADGAGATSIIGIDVATEFDTGMGWAPGVGGPAKSIVSCASALRCVEEPIANDSHPTRTPSGDQ
jgi:hypothetical protein